MKKLHFTIIAGLLFTMAITDKVEAQSNEMAARTSSSGKEIRKTFSQPVLENRNDFSDQKMNTRALKEFKNHYKNSDEKWAASEDGITALFNADNIRYAVYYDKKGHWIATLKSYAENLLDKGIRTMVKREYFDYKINGIQEINYNSYSSKPTYIVIVQNEKSIKWILITNDTMCVYKEF